MTVIIDSISFVAPERDLFCQGCSKLPTDAVLYPGYGKDNFGAWGAMLTCPKCVDPNKSPFFMCRICTSALFRKGRDHMVSDTDLRRHSEKATHIRTLNSYLQKVAELSTTAAHQPNINIADNHILVADDNYMDGNFQRDQNVVSEATTKQNNNVVECQANDGEEFPMADDDNSLMLVEAEAAQLSSSLEWNDNVNNLSNAHHNNTNHHADDNNNNSIQQSVYQQKTDWLKRLRMNAGNQAATFFQEYFPYDNRIHYFEHESLAKGGGAQALVGNAFYGPNVPVHGLTALYGLLFCRLAMKLPQQEVKMLSHLLHFIRSPPKAVLNDGGYRDIVVPTSPSEIRSVFLKGKKSIQTCLPTLPIQLIGSHVYVSPIDCVRDLMGMGQSVEPLFAGTSVHSRSPRGTQLLRSAYVWPAGTLGNKSHQPEFFVLPMYPWNDDIDPNNVKGNRHKVWVYLITFAIPERSIHRSTNTYIVAMGPGDEDHTEVERRIRNDFMTLANGCNFYFGPFRGPVRCVSLVYAHLADRPAKAASTCTLSGNSPLHSRFGYSGLLPNNLPSCDACHKQRMDNGGPATVPVVCTRCHDWSFDNLTYPRPNPFPQALSESVLCVKPITFESMKSAMSNLFENVQNGNWKSRKESQMFCKTAGLPVSVSDAIYDLAKSHSTPDDTVPILPATAIPPTWDHPLVEMEDWITAIMHQIFLGVVKATFGDMIKDLLTTRKMFSSFVSRTNRVLGPLKELRLSWLKVEPLSSDGKFGRFVSENYLAYARLSKWLYADLGLFPANDPNYEDPIDKDLGDYNKKELGAWLMARGIQYQSRMNKTELLTKIQQVVDMCSGIWPPIKWFERQTSPPELAEELIGSLLAMINRVMVKGDVGDVKSADSDRHIRIFLTLVHLFDTNREIQQPSNSTPTPIWISKYNFITLLSIPACQRKHGSLRLLWEGDGKGEGALPKIKSSIKSLKGQWALKATQRWYESRVLDRVTMQLLESLNRNEGHVKDDQLLEAANGLYNEVPFNLGDEDDEEGGVDDNDKIALDDFHVYKHMDEASRLFETGTAALSVVGYVESAGDDLSFGIVFKEKTVALLLTTPLKILPLRLDSEVQSYTACGASYFKWEACCEDAFDMPRTREFVKIFGVMLPNHNNGAGDRFFYLITSDWEEMRPDRSVGEPRALGCQYST